jgi:hypothetical protein
MTPNFIECPQRGEIKASLARKEPGATGGQKGADLIPGVATLLSVPSVPPAVLATRPESVPTLFAAEFVGKRVAL